MPLPYRKRTSAMVEGAIFAAIAIVFNLLFYYVPFLAIFINMIMPLPIVICGMRNGLKWSVLSTIVATVIVAMLVNPMHALFFIGVFGVLGVVLGECMYRRLKPKKLLFYSTLGGLASVAINLILALYVMGINPVEMMFSSLDASVPEFAAALGPKMAPEQLSQLTQQLQSSISMMKLILPGSMLLVAPSLVFINYWAARKIMGRLGEKFDAFPPLTEWILPPILAVLYIVSLIGIQLTNTQKEGIPFIASANVYAISSMLLVLDGLFVVWWYIKTKNKPTWYMKLLIFASFFVPLLSLVMTYVGGYDVLFDIRKLRRKKAEA